MKTNVTSTTICAIATAPGGAIGIVRVSGKDSITITDKIFKGKTSLTEAPPYSIHFGVIKTENELIDEVLVSVFKSPASYTGEDSIEISCHGSSYILNRVIELLLTNGCELASAGEFTMRAFLNGKMDLSQAEAVADLISASSKSQHDIAMTQMRGGISNKLSLLHEQLVELSSLLELELDFSEEDVEFADRTKLLLLANKVKDEIHRLISSFSDGNAIKNGIPVAIIGAPNVGKSTLLNALLGDDKAIVSNIKGTTRDVIEDTMVIDGVLFRFIDTAGIRHTEDNIEKLGIERSLKAIKSARIILLMSEPGVPFPEITTRNDQKVIRILNKSDNFQEINGKGLDDLKKNLLSFGPQLNDNSVLLTNLRHKQSLDLAYDAICETINAMQKSIPSDLVVEHLKQCILHLSEVVGKVTSDSILKNIFSKFCIGK